MIKIAIIRGLIAGLLVIFIKSLYDNISDGDTAIITLLILILLNMPLPRL